MRYLSPKKRENEVISGARQAVRLTHKSSKTHLFSLFSRPFSLFCCHICAMGNAHTRPQKQGCRRTWSACAWTLTWVTSVTKKRPFCVPRFFLSGVLTWGVPGRLARRTRTATPLPRVAQTADMRGQADPAPVLLLIGNGSRETRPASLRGRWKQPPVKRLVG